MDLLDNDQNENWNGNQQHQIRVCHNSKLHNLDVPVGQLTIQLDMSTTIQHPNRSGQKQQLKIFER